MGLCDPMYKLFPIIEKDLAGGTQVLAAARSQKCAQLLDVARISDFQPDSESDPRFF
jgi:hypothetical protein